jgi:hypothetical protein
MTREIVTRTGEHLKHIDPNTEEGRHILRLCLLLGEEDIPSIHVIETKLGVAQLMLEDQDLSEDDRQDFLFM